MIKRHAIANSATRLLIKEKGFHDYGDKKQKYQKYQD